MITGEYYTPKLLEPTMNLRKASLHKSHINRSEIDSNKGGVIRKTHVRVRQSNNGGE